MNPITAWVLIALLTAAWNLHIQLVIGGNWPPSIKRMGEWQAVGMLAALCLFLWPAVLLLMWDPDSRAEYRRALVLQRNLKRNLQVLS